MVAFHFSNFNKDKAEKKTILQTGFSLEIK